MGATCIFICIMLYFMTAVSCFMERDYPMTLVWSAYAVANIGFLWYELQR